MVKKRQKPAMALIRRGRSTMNIKNGANLRWQYFIFALF
jgi:hypothetical protein